MGTHAMGTRLADERWRSASLISTGSGGAVEADHVDLHRVEHGERGADLGARQHAPGQLDRHLGLQGHVAPERDHGAPGAVDGGLDREQVELRLDQQQVDAALEQAERLLLVRVTELGVGDVPERGELGARAHGAGDPAGALGRRELVPHRTGEVGRPPGQVACLVGQPVLGQHHGGRPEGVGLDDVAARLVEGAVDLGHQVGVASRRATRCTPRARAHRSRRVRGRAAAGSCPSRRRR